MRAQPCGRLAALFFPACLIAVLVLPGCGDRGPDTEYGLSRGPSLNGTSAFAAIFRQRGHEVRPAIRLSEELAEWAQGIVRFATYPGPPEAEEANWYREWLAEDPDRWLIYVVRDFDTQAEYWKEVRDGIAETADPERRALAEEKRAAAADWLSRLPKKAEKTGSATEWFKVEAAANTPKVCTKLDGIWARDVDAAAAALTVHESVDSEGMTALLSGDDKPLVLDHSVIGSGRTLIIANGSFLLNEALVKGARRPLAVRVADWPGGQAQNVAFVEGSFVLVGEEETITLWKLMERFLSFRWVAIQMAIAGAIAALARAPRLGRPRPDPVSGADRPAAHAEALGALLARGRATSESQRLLEQYRHWRWPQGPRQPGRVSERSRSGRTGPKVRPTEDPAPRAENDVPAQDERQNDSDSQ
jgi:hypothetical protein